MNRIRDLIRKSKRHGTPVAVELGWSVDEIAARQGKTKAAARMAVRRAIERLDAALGSSKPERPRAS